MKLVLFDIDKTLKIMPKSKPKNIKIVYEYKKDDTSALRLERAFDILFDEVKKNGNWKSKKR